MQRERDFIKIYGESVDEALSLLGPNIARIIKIHVQEKYSIRLTDTYNNPRELTDALRDTIDGGTRVIQRRILRSLYEKMGIEPNFVISTNFEEKILEAKRLFEKTD